MVTRNFVKLEIAGFGCLAFICRAIVASPVIVQTASLLEARVNHTATLLKDGRVFLAGGISQAGLAKTAEIYEPNVSAWRTTGVLSSPRHLHTATLLRDGRVLLVGGVGRGNVVVSQSEIYYSQSETIRPAATLQYARYWHTATLLDDGRVLIVGGYGVGTFIRPAEIYDPATDTFTVVGSLLYPRAGHVAARLPNGDVLIAGGQGYDLLAIPQIFNTGKSAEIFDVRRGVFLETNGLNLYRPTCEAAVLPDGRVAIFGGGDDLALRTTDIYDPVTGIFTWNELGPQGIFGRRLATATLLPDGRVILIAGLGSRNNYDSLVPTVEFFDPAAGTFATPSPQDKNAFMRVPRHSHTATLLPDGRVLIVGGVAQNGALNSCELLTP